MVMSVYDHMKGCIGCTPETVFSKLDEINVTLFNALHIRQTEDSEMFSRADSATITMYLIYAYSEKSEWLIIGADTADERQQIAERVGLPDSLTESVIKLKSSLVRKIILTYINTQTSRAFKYLSYKKDMYEAAMDAGMMSLTNEDGKIDVQQMVKSDEYLGKMLAEIKEYEEQLQAEYTFAYENKEEIDNIEANVRKKNDTGNVENSIEIN